MGPKKNKKKENDEEMWQKNQKNLQEIMKKVGTSNSKKQQRFQFSQDSDEEINTNKKQAFDWQLSKKNLKALQKAQQKKQQRQRQRQIQQQQAKKLTPQQQRQLQLKLQKQRQQKQKKQRKKEQKKAQRMKQIEQQKIEQQRMKQEQQKNLEQVEKKLKKTSTNGKCLPIFLGLLILLLCGLQYQKQIYVRLSKFKLQNQQNFYDVFEIDSGVTDKELKEKYKRLVLKYHPDKNPDCKQCEEKFNKIIKAWEVLGSPEKRKHYDTNSGFVTQIKSQSITLTPSNYNNLVEGSKSLWMIQVYDSTQKYCHYFAQFWEDIVQKNGAFIKFGRVDVWTQTDMLSYLPYRFQVFPSIYFYHKGQIGLCEFDFQNPDSSLRRCIESQYKDTLLKPINDLSQISQDEKVSIIFSDKMKIGSRFKIINKKYESDFNFYILKSENKKSQILALLPNNKSSIFDLDSKNPQYHKKYEMFLQSLILQKISICEFLSSCQNSPCFVILDEQNSKKQRSQVTLPQQNVLEAKPVYFIEDQEFYHALDDLKNRTQMMQKFTLGLYQNGHIDFGYFEDSMVLNPEEGQSFQSLHCVYKDRSWTGMVKQSVQKLIQMF